MTLEKMVKILEKNGFTNANEYNWEDENGIHVFSRECQGVGYQRTSIASVSYNKNTKSGWFHAIGKRPIKI